MTPVACAPDSLLAALAEPALILDCPSDSVVACNAAAARLLEGRADAPLRRAFSGYLGAALPQFVVFLQEVDHRGTACTREIAMTAHDGAPRACELRGGRLDGDAGRVLLTITDVAAFEARTAKADTQSLHRAGLKEWHRAEGFFAELDRRNQLILNAAGEGIYGVNAEGHATFVNRAAQEMLGWSPDDLLGRNIHDIIHHHHLNGEVYPAHDCPIYRSFRLEEVARIEDEVFWRKDGRPIRVEYVSTPIYDQQVLAGAVVIFRDVTERKENERRLHEALAEVAALRDRLEQENAYLQEAIDRVQAHHDIVGDTPAIRQLRARIDLVAQTDATVLITGETGTGKALVASAIHKASTRSRRPMIHFKCGAAAPDQVEAELFGQVRGAFPGALRDRPGKLELAHGGTLFLEDVADLSPSIQGRLQQVLHSRRVTRLGDSRVREIDVRVIAAMTATPDQALREGLLREDLLFSLGVFPVTCTPLRDRAADIPLLARHFLDLACRRLNLPRPTLTDRDVAHLTGYRWPGNVRELANVIERAAIVSGGGRIVLEIGRTAGRDTGTRIRTEPEMEQAMRDNLLACLRAAGGRVAGPGGAAELLGVRPTTFHSRMRRHGIARDDWAPTEAEP